MFIDIISINITTECWFCENSAPTVAPTVAPYLPAGLLPQIPRVWGFGGGQGGG
jgi:hypothetical protein